MKWIKADSLKPLHEYDMATIKRGDKIKIYGTEHTVIDFHGQYNSGLAKWETIIILNGRGDPFERSIDVIEINLDDADKNPLSPSPAPGQQLREALERIRDFKITGYGAEEDYEQLQAIATNALARLPAVPETEAQAEWEFLTIVRANYQINKSSDGAQWKGYDCRGAVNETYEDLIALIENLPCKRDKTKDTDKEWKPGEYHQPLFDLMHQEHGLTLLESEMNDIIHCVGRIISSPTPSEGQQSGADAIGFADAIKVLISHLREGTEEGSYYYSWQANIAMAFVDEWNRWAKPECYVHEVANNAAKNFLNNLFNK